MAAENGHLNVLEYLHEMVGLTVDDARADNNYAFTKARRYSRLDALNWLKVTFGISADVTCPGGDDVS